MSYQFLKRPSYDTKIWTRCNRILRPAILQAGRYGPMRKRVPITQYLGSISVNKCKELGLYLFTVATWTYFILSSGNLNTCRYNRNRRTSCQKRSLPQNPQLHLGNQGNLFETWYARPINVSRNFRFWIKRCLQWVPMNLGIWWRWFKPFQDIPNFLINMGIGDISPAISSYVEKEEEIIQNWFPLVRKIWRGKS